MQFSATPQTLAQLDQVPLYKFGTALNMLDNMQSADQQNLADLPNSIAHEQAMRPLREQQLDIGNQQGLAQLPGMKAQASMQVRKNQEEDLFTPERHAEFYAKHGAEKMKQYAQQLTDTGTVALNAASVAAKLPIGGNMAARDIFKQAGIQWHPEWDNLPREQLVQRLQDLGQEMTTNGSKSQQMIAQMDMKAQIAAATAQTTLDKEEMGIKAGKYNKPNRFGLSISQQLQNEADPVKKLTLIRSAKAQAGSDEALQAMMPLLEELERQVRPIAEAKLSAAQPKPGSVDITGVTDGAVPTQPPISLTPQGQPAQSETVSVVHPDGRAGTIPRKQLKEALAAGYKEKGK